MGQGWRNGLSTRLPSNCCFNSTDDSAASYFYHASMFMPKCERSGPRGRGKKVPTERSMPTNTDVYSYGYGINVKFSSALTIRLCQDRCYGLLTVSK